MWEVERGKKRTGSQDGLRESRIRILHEGKVQEGGQRNEVKSTAFVRKRRGEGDTRKMFPFGERLYCTITAANPFSPTVPLPGISTGEASTIAPDRLAAAKALEANGGEDGPVSGI